MRKVMLAMLVAVLVGGLTAPADAKGGKGPDPRRWTLQTTGACTKNSDQPKLVVDPAHGAKAPAIATVKDAWEWAQPPGWTYAGGPGYSQSGGRLAGAATFTQRKGVRFKGGVIESAFAVKASNGRALDCLMVVARTKHVIVAQSRTVGVRIQVGAHPHLDLMIPDARKGITYRFHLTVRAHGHWHRYRLRATAHHKGLDLFRWDAVRGLNHVARVYLVRATNAAAGSGYDVIDVKRLHHPAALPAAQPVPTPPAPSASPSPAPTHTTTPTPTPTPTPAPNPCPTLICL